MRDWSKVIFRKLLYQSKTLSHLWGLAESHLQNLFWGKRKIPSNPPRWVLSNNRADYLCYRDSWNHTPFKALFFLISQTGHFFSTTTGHVTYDVRLTDVQKIPW